MNADVSVAVVTFESEAHLVGCLEALPAAADGLRCEVCVVDNASSDGTVDLLRRRFPEHALFVNPANLGFAAAVNLAARQASAPALLLLNPDAVMLPGSLRSTPRGARRLARRRRRRPAPAERRRLAHYRDTTGTISMNTGTVRLGGGGRLGGTRTLALGTVLELSGGTMTMKATGTFSGPESCVWRAGRSRLTARVSPAR